MYQDTPFDSYCEIKDAVKEKKIAFVFHKNKRGEMCNAVYFLNKWVLLLFFLQFLFPIAFIVGYSYYFHNYLSLIAIPVYIIAAFIFQQKQLVATIITALGLLSIALHFPPVIVCLLSPAILCFWGAYIWWMAMQITLIKGILKEGELFISLWEKNVVAIIDSDNVVYEYRPQ